MKKIFICKILAVLLVLCIAGAAHAVPWKTVKPGKYFPLFGKPIQLESVHTTREICKDGKCYYTYKLIIKRPSRDDGWGRADFRGFKARLHYWSATIGYNPYITLAKEKRVFQNTHQDPHKIVVHIMQGLRPGKHRISVGIIPYPMIGNYSLKKVIQLYRGPYVTFLKDLKTLLSAINPAAAALDIVISHTADATINATIRSLATRYGQVFDLEVLAKMPDLHKKTAQKAALMLTMRNLVPQPDKSHPIYTTDKRLNGLVAKQGFKPGERVKAKTKVPYKFYKYRLGKEICGDGIDNNGNNQIDEGCHFKREIIIDDNECDDDTIKLFVDGKNWGMNPAGHIRHYNVSGLTRGQHKVTVLAVKSGGKAFGCQDNKIVTYSIKLGKGITFSGGGQYHSGRLNEGSKKHYNVIVK